MKKLDFGLKKNILKGFIFLLLLCLCLFITTVTKAQIPNGIQKSYYSTGELKQETPYKNGKKDGVEKHYNKDGTLSEELYYKKGTLEGKVMPETIRNYGYLLILKSWKFWAIIIGVGVAVWFLFTTIIFKNKAF